MVVPLVGVPALHGLEDSGQWAAWGRLGVGIIQPFTTNLLTQVLSCICPMSSSPLVPGVCQAEGTHLSPFLDAVQFLWDSRSGRGRLPLLLLLLLALPLLLLRWWY